MDSEMNDISLSDFTPYTIVASLEMSDEPNKSPFAILKSQFPRRGINRSGVCTAGTKGGGAVCLPPFTHSHPQKKQ